MKSIQISDFKKIKIVCETDGSPIDLRIPEDMSQQLADAVVKEIQAEIDVSIVKWIRAQRISTNERK